MHELSLNARNLLDQISLHVLNIREPRSVLGYGLDVRREVGQISFGLFNKAQEASQYPSVYFSDGSLTEEAFKLSNSQSLLAFLGQQLQDMDNKNVCELLSFLLPIGSRLVEQTRFDLFPESRRVWKIYCPLIPPDKIINQNCWFCRCNVILEL
jgi:hypothetical protein